MHKENEDVELQKKHEKCGLKRTCHVGYAAEIRVTKKREKDGDKKGGGPT